jgi:hypothetical protein
MVGAPVNLGEEVEYPRQLAGWDTDAVVPDAHQGVAILIPCRNLDAAVRIGDLAALLSRLIST